MNDEIDGRTRLLLSTQKLKAHFEERLKGSPLPDENREAIRDAFKSLVESSTELESQREALARLESRLELSEAELPSNVIPLRRLPSLHQELSNLNDRRWILRLDCLIEAKYLSEIHKMAMELHTQSHRYAFVDYRDLDKASRKLAPELLNMGAITLFIPDILTLTFVEQETLRTLMDQETINRPLLMVGSTLPYSELRCEPSIDIEFLARLSRAYIKLTKPFCEYKDQGLIHYFLDSLSQSPT